MIYNAPTYVALELTGDCNMKCRHCYGRFPRKAEGELTTEEACNIIDRLYQFGVFRLELGGGEPTLRMDFMDIVSYADRYSDINLSIVTNGISWTEEMITEFSKLKNNKKTVHISMDGYNPETYSILRRNEKGFLKALETTKLMLSYGIDVRWNYGIGKLTYPYLAKTLELAKEVGVPIIRLMVLYNIGRSIAENEMGFTYKEFQEFMIDYIENISINSPVSTSLALTQSFEFFIPLMEAGYSKNEITKRMPYAISDLDDPVYKYQTNLSCSGGRMMSAITSTGELHFCCILTSLPEFSCGNVLYQPLDHLWHNSEMYRWVRSLRLENLKTNCTECKYRDICGGGCRARAYYHSSDFLAPDPLCPFVQRSDKKSISPPFIENHSLISEREIKQLENIETFSVKLGDHTLRVRPEEFGASLFRHPEKYLNLNQSGFDILKSLHHTGDPLKVSKFLSEKYALPMDKVVAGVDDFLKRLEESLR